MNDNYNILIAKLDEFIRKYYKNKLIRGLLYCVAILFVFYLTVVFLEYIAWFNSVVRAILFYSFIFISAFIIWRFIIVSAFKLNRIGKIISNEFAAEIIGNHFPEVKDKLLNTLQLKQLSEKTAEHKELIEAGIDQKIQRLTPVPFASAVNLKENYAYLKYALPPFLIFLILLFASPSLLTGPTLRLIKHNVYFEKPLPYQIIIINEKLEAVQQEDFRLNIKITGNEVPDEIYIQINQSQFKLDKENTVNFHYTFKNLRQDTRFSFVAGDFTSKPYEIKVLPKPTILNFNVELNYPSYINKKNETLDNTGDLIIPAGTKVSWKFFTKDTRNIILKYFNLPRVLNSKTSVEFKYSDVFRQSTNYSISAWNNFMSNKDSLYYMIQVIPDAYPTIDVQEYKDSVFMKHFYFKGMIRDDYGFSKLVFKVKKTNASNKADSLLHKTFSENIPIVKNQNTQEFYFHFDLNTFSVLPGEELEYYFEVWDNDGVNGSKATMSQKNFIKTPTKSEIAENSAEASKKMEKDIQSMIREAKNLQRKADELNQKLIDKKSVDWQDKKDIQDILDKEKHLQNEIEDIKQQNMNKNNFENQYNTPDEELLNKQELLEKMFDEVMTEDMKELFKNLEKMMDEMDKDKLKEMLDNTKLSNKDIEKALDRNLEIFKQLEFEKKLDKTINDLDEVQKKQDNLSNETKEKSSDSKDLNDKQNKLNQDFKDIKKDLDQLEKTNKELETPNHLENTEEQEKNIENEQNAASESLKQNKKAKASQSQKNAASQMKKLSDKMKKMQEEMQSGEEEENEEALRSILENLVQSSFNQENLMNKLKATSISDPQYPKIISEQKKIKDDLQMIEDSLFALSKRQIEIQPFVNTEINKINQSIEKTLNDLQSMHSIVYNFRSDDLKSQAMSRQQFAMTSINNLALLLSESLDQMQQSSNMDKQGQGQCKSKKSKMNCQNPGNGKPSIKSLRQMQEQLNKQMEALKKGMEQGKKPGTGNKSYNEQLARLAAQQSAIREQLRKISDQLKGSGKKNSGDLSKMMDEMNKTETDLVNKRIQLETMKRQQDILTRLLESEKAEKEREQDEKRESHEQKNDIFSNPKLFFKYNRLKEKNDELLKTVPLDLNSFYKQKVNEYFYKFEK